MLFKILINRVISKQKLQHPILLSVKYCKCKFLNYKTSVRCCLLLFCKFLAHICAIKVLNSKSTASNCLKQILSFRMRGRQAIKRNWWSTRFFVVMDESCGLKMLTWHWCVEMRDVDIR